MASELSRRRASVMSQSQAIASRLDAAAEAAETGTNGARRVEYDEEEPAAGRRRPRYDVFINHRGVDTKRNVARLLYDRLQQLAGGGVRSFLDSMSMRPGDRLNERIYEAIRECRVAVAIFSPRYFDSEFCLEELAAIVEARKIIIPIFYDIKPSELVLPPAVVDSKEHLPRDIERFRLALREVKYTVGLCHDSTTGDLADLVSAAANAVLERIEEMGSVQRRQMIVSRL